MGKRDGLNNGPADAVKPSQGHVGEPTGPRKLALENKDEQRMYNG